jgi:hypothetical protein
MQPSEAISNDTSWISFADLTSPAKTAARLGAGGWSTSRAMSTTIRIFIRELLRTFWGRAIVQALICRFPGLIPAHVMWDLWWTKWQVCSEYFGFPCQFSFHQMLYICLLSGAGRIGQLVADVPSGLSLNPALRRQNKNRNCTIIINILRTAWTLYFNKSRLEETCSA